MLRTYLGSRSRSRPLFGILVVSLGASTFAACSDGTEIGQRLTEAEDGSTVADSAPRADIPSEPSPDGGLQDAHVNAPQDLGPCTSDMTLVTFDGGSACVDRYEGALVHGLGDGGETAWPYNRAVDDLEPGTYRAVVARGQKPQGYISSDQAEAACKASAKRLCTRDEWTAACRGRPDHDNVYPYGNTYEAGACNEGKPSPIITLYGPNPTYSSAELNDRRCDELDGGLAKGGDYPKCVSAYGAFDMHGNLHEWVEDSANAVSGTFLGGYFVDAKLNGTGCSYRTTAHQRTYHDYSTGFRCCSNPRR